MHRYFIIILSLTLLLLGAACSKNKALVKDESPKPAPEPAEKGIHTQDSARQNNHFAFNLFEVVNHPDENLLFSPYSINTAMGMAYTGAKKETAEEMAKVMGYKLPPEEQHRIFGESVQRMNQIGKGDIAQLYVANAIFNAEENRPFLEKDFAEILGKSFESELYHLDFDKSRESAEFINKWVEKNTNERIKDIVSERQIATSNDGLVLVNSIYFKAPWLHGFDAKKTREDRFHVTRGGKESQSIPIPMMHQREDFGYAEVDDVQILEMPYEDRNLSMVFILPQDMEKMEARLSHENWELWLKQISKPQPVDVFMPRFRLEETMDELVDSFKKMGMIAPFDGYKADFSGILKPVRGNLYITDIVHKAFLEVVESGTEAAAATQIGFAKMSYTPAPEKIPVFRADRPFFCMILHKEANEILFAAKVLKPEAVKD